MQIRLSASTHLIFKALLTAVAASLCSSCVVDDRNFDEEFAKERSKTDDSDDTNDNDTTNDTTEDASHPTLCGKYCDEIMAVCVQDNAVFATKDACLSACEKLEEAPPADEGVENTNTVACRYKELQDAKEEAAFHCPRAAIASQVCGSPCETYCRIHGQVCDLPTEVKLEQAECERRCEGVPMTPTFSLQDNYKDDSIQCRLIHLVSASASDSLAATHCPHARLASPLLCGEMAEVSCKNYCATLSVACTGALAQYTSVETCEKTCMALPAGAMADRAVETVGCRHYHAYASLGAPDLHCSHAGPTTDGHCGDAPASNCTNYCLLAKAACGDEFTDKYEDNEGCMSACLPLPGAAADSEYPPVELPEESDEDTQVVQRLMREATKVLGEEDGASCDGVFPDDGLLGL